jgi:hypothetical protein
MAPEAVTAIVFPIQISAETGLTANTGSAFTIILMESEPIQPLPSVAVTWYHVVVTGLTEIVLEWSPVLQRKVVAGSDATTESCVLWPAQITPLEVESIGLGDTTT